MIRISIEADAIGGSGPIGCAAKRCIEAWSEAGLEWETSCERDIHRVAYADGKTVMIPEPVTYCADFRLSERAAAELLSAVASDISHAVHAAEIADRDAAIEALRRKVESLRAHCPLEEVRDEDGYDPFTDMGD